MFAKATRSKLNKAPLGMSLAGLAEAGLASPRNAGNQASLHQQRPGSSPDRSMRPSQTFQLHRKASGNAIGNTAPPIVNDVLGSSGQKLDSQTRAFMEPRFGRDLSHVRIHTDAKAADSAEAVNAKAYAVGQHIAFGSNSYSPSTAQGKHLLAHELAHTVQNNAHNGTVRRRRVPDKAHIDAIMPAAGPDYAVHLAGLLRLLRGAWNEFSNDQKKLVFTESTKFGIATTSDDQLFGELAVANRDQIVGFVQEVQKVDPTIILSDPTPIDTGPQPGTNDAANINTLVAGADSVFAKIAHGSQNKIISDVFGQHYVQQAKANFADGHRAMHRLQSANKIVTDRSGYSYEAGIGGGTVRELMRLANDIVDAPTDIKNIALLVHESMHAGNPSVKDRGGYIDDPSFATYDEKRKIANAADYQVVAIRILDPNANHDPFIPAGATSNGKKQPGKTKIQTAMGLASDDYRLAWTAAVNLHVLFVREFTQRAEWNTQNFSTGHGVSAHLSASLPYWSKVENMTIHKRMSINPAGGAQSTAPVTEIDIAQSESVIHKLFQGFEHTSLPRFTETHALDLEKNIPKQTIDAMSAAEESKVLVSLILSEIGEITGPVERDVRVIERLSKAFPVPGYDDALKPKDPSTFAD